VSKMFNFIRRTWDQGVLSRQSCKIASKFDQ